MIENGDLRLEIEKEFVGLYTALVAQKGTEHEDLGAKILLKDMKHNGFFDAPASTKYHGCYDGGLARHSLNVFERLMNSGAPKKYTLKTIATVALLHDVCKMDAYRKEKTEDGKEIYVYNKDAFPAGHGEKSVFIIQKYMRLTDEELLAVRWHMGAFDDAVRGGSRDINAAYRASKLAVWLHLADMEATYIDEREE